MQLSLDLNSLSKYTSNQINRLFFDGVKIRQNDFNIYINDTIDRLYACFKEIKKPYYYKNGSSTFNHLHSDHYAMYLYLLANTIWRVNRNEALASKVFLLNKALHGLDAFYAITLPEIFLFVHPVGTVLGNAKYSNFFAVYQNCTIGSEEDAIYPTFEGETILFSKSTVIGNCNIGANTVFGANCFIINSNIEKDSVVLNAYPDNRILRNNKNVIDRLFR